MEKLNADGTPGDHETWQELADHSLTHDDVPAPPPQDIVATVNIKLPPLASLVGRKAPDGE